MGLHTDRRNHEGIPDGYVQGLVNLIPTSPASGGNVIIPKSHKYVDDLDEVRSLMKDGQSFYECASASCRTTDSAIVVLATLGWQLTRCGDSVVTNRAVAEHRPEVFESVITAHVRSGQAALGTRLELWFCQSVR